MGSGRSGRRPRLRIAWGVLRNSGGSLDKVPTAERLPAQWKRPVRHRAAGWRAVRSIHRPWGCGPLRADSVDGAGCRI
jgi:hypothetical protein